jgi:hypothetical protein
VVDMLVLIASVGILVLINIAAVVGGTDSRDTMPDDHRRALTDRI